MLVQWNPWSDLARFERAVNHLFDHPHSGDRAAQARGRNEGDSARSSSATIDWQPAVDVLEDNERILLVADLPGLDEKDLDISIDKNVLTVRGERKAPTDGDPRPHRIERVYGRFSRSFTLPNVVDTEKIKAEFKDGVLRVTLPQREEAKPKQITIAVTK